MKIRGFSNESRIHAWPRKRSRRIVEAIDEISTLFLFPRARNLSSLGQEKIHRTGVGFCTLRACKISPQYAVLFIRQLISITARRDGGQRDGWIASRARVYSHRNGVHLPQSSSSSSSPLPSRRGLHSRVLCISTYTRRAIPSLCCLLLLFHYPFHTRLSHSSSSHLPHRPTPSAPLPLVGGA